MGHRWKPIADYEVDVDSLADTELAALSAVWREQKPSLDGIDRFTERLKREWAIETGLLERLYTLDRGVTELLIERGIDAAAIPHRAGLGEAQVAMIGDQKDAIDSVFAFVKGDRPLSTSYINELHHLFTRNQDFAEGRDQFGRRTSVALLRGQYKQRPNNPTQTDGSVHEYCPPEHVAAEMDRLIELHHRHSEAAPEAEAAWLHHRFAQIHPFQDGNGRVARALATLIFIKAGWLPLVVRDQKRDEYIDSLEAADRGDLAPLVGFFSALQKKEFVQAISIAREIEKSARVETRIKGIGVRIAQRQKDLVREWEGAVESARRLHRRAENRSEEVRDELEATLSNNGEFRFLVDSGGNDRSRNYWFRRQIISTAQTLGYFANMDTYKSWVRLRIADPTKEGTWANVLISFHAIGHEFRGVLACSATWFEQVPTDDESPDSSYQRFEATGARPLCADVFRINYRENVEDIENRFQDWLDAAIDRGLALWESRL